MNILSNSIMKSYKGREDYTSIWGHRHTDKYCDGIEGTLMLRHAQGERREFS